MTSVSTTMHSRGATLISLTVLLTGFSLSAYARPASTLSNPDPLMPTDQHVNLTPLNDELFPQDFLGDQVRELASSLQGGRDWEKPVYKDASYMTQFSTLRPAPGKFAELTHRVEAWVSLTF